MKLVIKVLLLILLSLLTLYWKWSTAQIDNAKKRHVEYYKPVLINGYVVLFSEKKWERNANQRYSFRYTSQDAPKRFIEIAHHVEGNHDKGFDVIRSLIARPLRKLSNGRFVLGGSTLEGSAAGKALYGATTPWWGALAEYRFAKQIAQMPEQERNAWLYQEICDLNGETSCYIASMQLFSKEYPQSDKQMLQLLSTVRYGNNNTERKRLWAIDKCTRLKQKLKLNIKDCHFKNDEFVIKNKLLRAEDYVWFDTNKFQLRKKHVQQIAALSAQMSSIQNGVLDVSIADIKGNIIARISNNTAVVKGFADSDRNLASLAKLFYLECLNEELDSKDVSNYATSSNGGLLKMAKQKVNYACLTKTYGTEYSLEDISNGRVYMSSQAFQMHLARIVKHSNASAALRAPINNEKGTLHYLKNDLAKSNLTLISGKSGTHSVRQQENSSENGVYGSLISLVVKNQRGEQMQILIRWHGSPKKICVKAGCTRRVMHQTVRNILPLIH